MAGSVLDETPTAVVSDVAALGDHGDNAPCHAGIQHLKQLGRWRGQTSETISVTLKVVTPIMGGSPVLRKVDQVDIIRGPSIRGHLRFWWRALNAHLHLDASGFPDANKLYDAERAIWGGAADTNVKGGRSKVDVQVQCSTTVAEATNLIKTANRQNKVPGGYATWPTQLESGEWYSPGLQFKLNLNVQKDHEPSIRNALRAWILFGGYGGRTRRGLGSLTVLEQDCSKWLPDDPTPQSIKHLFGYDIFAAPAGFQPNDTPCMAGAALNVGQPSQSAPQSWAAALGWLQEFRQGPDGGKAGTARNAHSSDKKRASISNWPEADKVRRFSLSKLRWAHPPRHNDTPAWPRAGFGLPIVGKFNENSREVKYVDEKTKRPVYYKYYSLPKNRSSEPDPYEISWIRKGDTNPQNRLASPVIVKALPLANGKSAPCALWLNRDYPKDGEVTLIRNGIEVASTARASFNTLVAAGDTSRFAPLRTNTTLRQAFLDWLVTTKATTVVAP